MLAKKKLKNIKLCLKMEKFKRAMRECLNDSLARETEEHAPESVITLKGRRCKESQRRLEGTAWAHTPCSSETAASAKLGERGKKSGGG